MTSERPKSKTMQSLLTTPGFCTEKIAVYLAQGLSQGDTHPDEDEFLGLVRLPLEEAARGYQQFRGDRTTWTKVVLKTPASGWSG